MFFKCPAPPKRHWQHSPQFDQKQQAGSLQINAPVIKMHAQKKMDDEQVHALHGALGCMMCEIRARCYGRLIVTDTDWCDACFCDCLRG